MTTAFILRHGPTQENMEGRIQGQQPGTLLPAETEHYISQIVPLLRTKTPTVLISSDLERAVRTREILREFLQLPQMKEAMSPLLREKAMGYYEGMLWSEVPGDFQEQKITHTYDFRKFGGENTEDVMERVRKFLLRVVQQYPNQHICCVTHAGWINQLVRLADKEGILPDGWTDRTAIYEAGIGSAGQLQYFHPIQITAELPEGDD